MKLNELILLAASSPREPAYTHRVSGVARCPREAAMHANGMERSDPADPIHGNQFRFDIGHDVEARVISAMESAGLGVGFNQLRVLAHTPGGLAIPGHIDGIVLVPEGVEGGGAWYLFDVKSAGTRSYQRMFWKDAPPKAKQPHLEQVAVYANGIVEDDNYPEISGVRLRDLEFDGMPCGGGMILYLCVDSTARGSGDSREYLPRLTDIHFDLDDVDVDAVLAGFDEVEQHRINRTIPPKPENADGRLWPNFNRKTRQYKPVRCSPRWCERFSLCQEV